MINKGDEVTCIDNTGLESVLEVNKVYKVTHVTTNMVKLDGLPIYVPLRRVEKNKSLEDLWLEWEIAEGRSSETPPIPKCTCGAKHTSAPKLHTSWCDILGAK